MADTSSAFGYGALYFEKETDFGTEPVGGILKYLEAISWKDNRDQKYFENDVIRQGLQQHTSGIVGHKSESDAELEMYLHGYSDSSPVAAPGAADVHPDADLLACALGGILAGGYDGTGIVALGTTVNHLVVTDASSFVAGQAVLVNGEIGWVSEVTTGGLETLDLLHDLRAKPDAADKVYGCIVTWPTDMFDATDSPSLAFRWRGLRADDVVKYLGCRINSCKISGSPRDFLRMTLGINVTDFGRADTGGDPELETYVYPDREQIIGARLLLRENTGTVLPMEADCSKFDLDFMLAISPKIDLNASQGVSEWRKTATKATLEIDPIQGLETSAVGWEKIFQQKYQFTVVLQVGTTEGRTVSVCLPAGELTEFPKTSDREGLNAKSLKFTGMAHARCTAAAYGDAYPANKTCLVAFA